MGILEEENYRVRTKRQKKRILHKAKEKQLIRYYREYKVLSERIFRLPMIDLEIPFQRGWKRYFIVREDVRRGKEGKFYESILEKINTVQYNHQKNFKQKKRKENKRVYIEIKQELKVIYPNELPKLKLSEKELECFDYRLIVVEIGGRKIERYAYVFREPWRFILRIRPNIITQVKAYDWEMEQRRSEIKETIFDNYENCGKLNKLKGWGKYHWENKLKYANPIKNKPMHSIIEEANADR